MSTWSGRVLWALLLVACGGKQQDAKTPSPAVIETPGALAEDPPDLSPVKRPAEVVAVARLARPQLFFETLAKWGSLPVRLSDALPLNRQAVDRAVLWEAPIEAVVALDNFGEGKVPRPHMVVSLGLKSLEAGLSAADAEQVPTRRVAPGVYRVGEVRDTSCAIAASVGSAPARLVCGPSAKDVDALLPYATRGLPVEPQSGADFELVVDAKPIQDRYGGQITALRLLAGVAMREVALDSQRFDRALSDAIYGGIDEVINVFGDLQQIRLEARLDASRQVLLGSAELRLSGNNSWVAGTIAATKPGPVPAALPRLPPGTGWAQYTVALPAERYVAIGRVLGDLAEGYLEHEKLPEGTRKRLRRSIEPWLTKWPETFSFAVPPGQTNADGSTNLHPDTGVTRISEASPRVVSSLDDFFGLLSDPALKRWVTSKIKVDAKAWPKVTKKPLKLAGFKTAATVYQVALDINAWSAASPSLSKAFERLFPATMRDRLGRFTVVVQPDGEFTYLITGEDTAEIVRVMAEHKKSEPGMVFVRPARAELVTSAGFVTLASVARSFERSSNMPEARKALSSAPHRGDTPLPFSTSVGAGTTRVDVELPAAFFADVAAAMVSAGSKLGRVLEKR